MSKVVNLNQARKRKQRQAATLRAAENRVIFGRSKLERQQAAAAAAEAQRRLDGLQREPGDDSDR